MSMVQCLWTSLMFTGLSMWKNSMVFRVTIGHFMTHTDSSISVLSDNFWREPVPFNLSSEYGVAMAHSGNYCWLSNANGVWRSSLAEANLDITPMSFR